MAKILVFNNNTDRIETYYRGESELMPYNINETLRVRKFRTSSKSNILWTTKIRGYKLIDKRTKV